MKRYIDLSVTVNDATLSPPSTNMPLEITPHRRGPGFWQVSSVRQSLHTGAHIDSPLHVFKDGMTTAEISLDRVMGEAIVVDLSFVGPMHRVILGAGVVIMEGLTNLGALPRRRVEFAAPFYKIAGTEGAPARFFAVV